MDLKNLAKISQKTFSTTIPSLGIEVFGMPYNLNDEITIASLYQLEDIRFFYAGVANLLLTKYSLDPETLSKLTAVDIQWLQLQLKINSDGPTIDIEFECEKCKSALTTKIDLQKIVLENPKMFKKTVSINPHLSIEIGLPTFDNYFSILTQYKEIKESELQKTQEKNIELYKLSIKAIYSGSEIKTPSDFDPKEWNEFVTTTLRPGFLKFISYMDVEAPRLVYPVEIVCGKEGCGTKTKLSVDDFFYSTL